MEIEEEKMADNVEKAENSQIVRLVYSFYECDRLFSNISSKCNKCDVTQPGKVSKWHLIFAEFTDNSQM